MGDLQGHPFRGNQWTAGQSAAMDRMHDAARMADSFRGQAMDRMHDRAHLEESKRGAGPSSFDAAPRIRTLARRTAAEATAAEDYSSGTLMMVNAHLRSGAYDKAVRNGTELELDDGGGTMMSAEEARVGVKALDNAIAKSQLEADATVYRVIGEDAFARSLKTGVIFRDDGFVSTTSTEAAARDIAGEMGGSTAFSGARGSGVRLLRIEVPKGSPALDMNAVLKEHKKFNAFEYQHEVLLPRRSSFKVIRSDKSGITLRFMG